HANATSADEPIVADSVAHHDHRVGNHVGRNIIETDKGECGVRVDFNECQICFVIPGDVVSVVSFTVVCRHGNFQVIGALDHMLIGNDITGRINNETGAEALQSLANFARPDAVVAKELRVKILKWIAHRAPDYALGVN